MAADEDATVAALDSARAVFHTQVREHGGRVVDTAGDSVLAVFESAGGAVDAALAIQRRLTAAAVSTTPDQRLLFRIGIHLGDVIEKPDGSVYGNGVNVAARLQALAEPGGICVSDTVRHAVGARAGRNFEDRGTHAVKNIAETVHVFRLSEGAPAAPYSVRRRLRPAMAAAAAAGVFALAATAWWLVPGASISRGTTTPNLRPLSLMIGSISAGDDAGMQISEHLGREFGAAFSGPRYRNSLTLLTSPATSSSAQQDLAQARAAGARFLLEGVVNRARDRHVVDLRITETDSGARQWSGRLEVKPDDGAEAQAGAVRELVVQIGGHLYASETRRVLALPLPSLAPVELMLRGSAVYDAKPTMAGIDEAMKFADFALVKNPDFVPALNLKAFLLANRYDEEAHPDHERYANELNTLTARMLVLDPVDPYSLSLRAIALMYAGQWAAAAEAADTLLRIERSPFSLIGKAEVLIYSGQPAEALKLIDGEAASIRPQAWALVLTCRAHLLMGEAHIALASCEKAVGTDPAVWSAHLYLAAVHAELDHIEEARASLKVVERMSPGHTIDRLRKYRYAAHPAYRALAETHYFAALRKAGMPER